MTEKQEMTAKEKLLLMIDTLSENYAYRVIDYINGLQAGQNLAGQKEGEKNKLAKTSA